MPMPTVSFLLGLVVLGYLSTFIAFAILRIVTGISIQRVGYTGFRRIAFSPRPGIKINIRGVGLSPHRPTFALPTWCSLVITELVVTVDLQTLGKGHGKNGAAFETSNGSTHANHASPPGASHDHEDEDGHGRLWRRLTNVKERIKKLHRKINWIRLVDIIAAAATLDIIGVGTVRLERLTLSVDTRKQTVDRSRLFEHHKHRPEKQSPAEWKSLIRSVLFTPEGGDSTEILDYGTLNIHGMLHQEREGLRDASITLKLGRVNVPYDDIERAKRYADLLQGKYAQPFHDLPQDVSLTDVVDELEKPGSREQHIVRTVSDSRAFVASILRGIQEVQFAIGFVGVSHKVNIDGYASKDVYFNFAMKELGLDVLRLDPKSPAHRMHFTTRDVAHQGLLTGIAISAGIDDGLHHPERMAYIPMITATVKTTLPSRTIQYDKSDAPSDRNTNIFYANFVCTSPSIDLDPKHLPLVRELLKRRASQRAAPPRRPTASTSHRLISQLLPKAHLKFSIEEPVVRISLPPMDKSITDEDDFDLLISSMSSIAVECESSHASDGQNHYSLDCYYRHSRHRLYYQTAAGDRHDLLESDFIELQVGVNAIPDVSVVATGRAQTFTLFLERPDICEGVRQIVKQLRKDVLGQRDDHRHRHVSYLRTMPGWLQSLRLEGSDFGLKIAGVDEQVSKDTRGFALQLESWFTEYKTNRDHNSETLGHRKSITKSTTSKDKDTASPEPSGLRKRYANFGDDRRLTVHIQNLEGLIVDSIDDSQPESFMSLPRFEIAFSTSSDAHGPIFHINSFAKSIYLQYSLYNHFAIGVAAMVIKSTFLTHDKEEAQHIVARRLSIGSVTPDPTLEDIASREITAIDFKAPLVQIKARMPADPPMMLQVFGLDCGRHRWSAPFLRCRLARLYVKAPLTKAAWSRVVSIKVLRLDLRELKRKVGKMQVSERSIDAVAETIRICVPHSLVIHTVFDNIINVVKTSKQLQHHFLTGTNEYILTKEPEGPKHVPRITLRSQLFVFEIEDSSFEWKLGAIYRAGLLEQKQRLAREEAFKLKEKRVSRAHRNGYAQNRAHSAHPEDRSRSQKPSANDSKRRSRSSHPAGHSGYERRHRHSRREMRYDAEGKCGISDTSQLTIEQAREKLGQLNSQSWKRRIDRMLSFQHHFIREMRTVLWGMDDLPDDIEQHEPILAISQRPGLLAVAISNINVAVDKPSFPIDDFPQFMHDVGKGMPKNMKYGLLIPMNLHITMGEARFHLRDYPLPLLHIPALGTGQSPRLPAASMRTDFIVAEEFRDIESQRQVDVEVIPPHKMSDKSGSGFSVDVRRTISSIKTYSDIKFDIHTNNPTKLTWSTSYQPAIQDTMQILEGFTKPPVDPSDRLGFWDKIRLAFHSRVNVAWKGDGDFHLILKGSRDPYVVTGHGAGLVMVWRNDVNWTIARSDDPRKFMTVDSGEYILAVPDFNNYARRTQDANERDDASSTSSNSNRDAVFKKVVMKLKGKVTWLAGLMFERDLANGKRTFEFEPHYDVVLKHPDFAKGPHDQVYDAYRGFRSHHIHMSIGISAPPDRDWSVTNLKPSANYNSVHLTPRFSTHFFSWWHMFSGVMSLPIRQGPLWGITQKKSKKFGRHIASIKYNLLLSPLYISHVYKHKDAEDYEANVVSATGLKMRLDSFMLDLHQRREYFDLKGREGARGKKTSGMRINQAQLDFISADLRAVSANIGGTSATDIEKATDETLATLHSQLPVVDLSKFEIPDRDQTWIDMDDFVELDWILPAEADPETKILPLGYSPRVSYFRQTDHNGIIGGDTTRSSPFGDEPTHFCVMSAKNDPRRVQVELIQRRLELIKEKQAENVRAVGAQELKVVQDTSGDKATQQALAAKLETLKSHTDQLQEKHDFLKTMLDTLVKRLEEDDPSAVPDLETSEEFFEAHENARMPDSETTNLDSMPHADHTSDFNNRFIVHNAQIKWNNSLRNIILRYIHQNGQRRGFVYYMSRRAVKFILDVVDERKKSNEMATPTRQKSYYSQSGALSPDTYDDEVIQDRIDQLLQDGRTFVDADEPVPSGSNAKNSAEGPGDDIATEFTALNTYLFRLIAPQVQLQSEKNPKSAVLVTAKGMQLKVVEIMEKEKIDDDVSGLVQRRFHTAADSVQMFVTSTKSLSTEYLHFYSANRYGVKYGTHWPPWVPMEVVLEFETNPYGFNRVVHRTSASLRYDKYNTLRLKYNDDISGGDPKTAESAEEAESRIDHVWLEFPHFRAICDSRQYFALYIMVMDLLLYSEPLEKTRSERLEKIMLASDFSDLTGAPEMVQLLQERIRQLEEIKLHFQVNEKYLDRQGWKDRIAMDQELAGCEDELFFLMKAITTSQQRVEDRRDQENATGHVHLHVASKEIAWHLIRDKGDSLMEVQFKNASFDRTDNNDGSNYNCMEIGRINGFNLLEDAIYPEIIAPFVDESRGGRHLGHEKMFRIQWLMLEAIAGIPVVDYFEIDLVPLKLQVENEVAKKLFEYIFPSVGSNAFEGGFSPFTVKNILPAQQEEVEEDEEDQYQDHVPDDGQADETTTHIEAPEPGVTHVDSGGPGSLEQRLRPTLHLTKQKKLKSEHKGLGISNNNSTHGYGLTLFHHSDKSRPVATSRSSMVRQNLSQTNLSPAARSSSERSLVTMRSEAVNVEAADKSKRFHLHHSHNDEKKKKDKGREARSDDLTQMMNRASNYMTLAFVKIPSMVLCLSYKGQGKRNLEDVHDLVFRMPTLEYRNKTWSNLDLALQLKKDVMRALISHVGAIVGNKFSHHRPNRQQQSKLRELANKSTFLSSTSNSTTVSSLADWTTNSSETSLHDPPGGRFSGAKPPSSMLTRSISYGSTPSLSGDDIRSSNDTSHNGNANGDSSSLQGSVRKIADGDTNESRQRAATITRHLSGLGDRIRRQTSNNNSTADLDASQEDTEETKRKSKLLLGGQKLLGRLRDQ